MEMKTLTGSSIQAALARAREQLGDHVVLIESTPATEERPAQIAVMVDDPASERAAGARSRKRVPKPPEEMPARTGGSADPSYSSPGSSGEGAKQQSFSSFGGSSGGSGMTPQEQTTPEQLRNRFDTGGDAGTDDPLAREKGTGRGRLFPPSGSETTGGAGRGATHDKMIEARHRRLKARRGGRGQSDRASSAERWATHPLFGSLLDQGMRPETVAQLFDDLADRGVDLHDSDPDDLRWAFSQVLCRRIEVAKPEQENRAIALMGPGGAGKTSLVLKLAANDELLAGQDPAVIHVLPEHDRSIGYQNPTDLYRRFGLPVQGVRSRDDMVDALERVDHLGQVIVDTPALPLPLEEARPVLRRYAHLLRPLMPMDVHFVMSAMHGFGPFEAGTLQDLPIVPSATAITHLDETRTWGRVAEWVLELDLPVRFVSTGPDVPEGARDFSLKWFVEDVMDL